MNATCFSNILVCTLCVFKCYLHLKDSYAYADMMIIYIKLKRIYKQVLRRAAEETAPYSKVSILRIIYMKCVEIENEIH